ncbi:hypothetical protein HOK09_02105 [Candidatus Woesearchaeota archaeon]|nr:hypothetical protein [Candidatus Woesearchaeota archaeon]
MKVPDELLAGLVKRVAGNDTVKIFEILTKRKNVSEFKIAEKLGISVNQVRNMIYRLQEHNLVSFTRKKDKVKGWYIYYWTFEKPKAVELIVDITSKETKENQRELDNIEDIRYYLCKYCRTKLGEEEAMELQFLCEGCGEILELQDANKRRRDLTKKLKKDKESHIIAKAALDYHRKLVARATDRLMAKEKAEKDKIRAAARKATADAKRAALEASGKSVKKTTAEKTTKKATAKKAAPKKKTTKKAPVKKTTAEKTTKKATAKKAAPKKKTTKKAPVKKTTAKKTVVETPNKKKGILGRVFKK